MHLRDYLRAEKLTDEQFAARLSVSPFAVGKWRRGERFPRRELLRRIEAETKGRVTAADLLAAPPANDAVLPTQAADGD
jgi:transcriptional regulator with XRE-family HTH domain